MIYFTTAYFILIDRGMGVVSLHSYQHGGHRIRVSNCVLEGKVSIWAYQNSVVEVGWENYYVHVTKFEVSVIATYW